MADIISLNGVLLVRTIIGATTVELHLDGFFCQTKINFTKPGPLPTSKMELFVTIFNC